MRWARGMIMACLLGAGALILCGCERFLPAGADARLGEACFAAHDHGCAERHLRAFLRGHPNDAKRTAYLAFTLSRQNRCAEALPYYERLEAWGLRTHDIYANHGRRLAEAGRLE